MKTGRTLPELAQEIQRQAAAKHDFVAPTADLTLLNGKELHLDGIGEFEVQPLAHQQIGDHLGIPSKFYERLQAKHPTLLDHNVNTLFRAEPSKRLVRAMDGGVRAFLSERYQCFDHVDLANAVLPILQGIPDVDIPSCEITERRLFIKALAPRLHDEVKVGDEVQAGLLISNSEVGLGRLVIELLIYRLSCKNGMVGEEVLARRHVGRRIGEDVESPIEVFKEETRKADDRAYWLMVRDLVESAVSETRFRAAVQKLRLATETEPIQSVEHGVKEIGKRFSLGEGEQSSLLQHLAMGGDLTKYGTLNAVTAMAQTVESYDRSVELERVGGRVLELPDSAWREIAAAGPR